MQPLEPLASIDRLTVVGDLDGSFTASGHAVGHGLVDALEVCRSYAVTATGGKYPYGSAFTFEGGGFVAFARRDAVVPLVRVDVNPNKLGADSPVREVIGLMFDTRCTRLDVAVDYPGEPVGEWMPYGRAGKRFTVGSRAGGVETRMVGARSSARQLVVYDKIADAKAKHEDVPWGLSDHSDLMRVEARERYRPADAGGVLGSDLMDDVILSRVGAEFSGLNIKDRALLHYLSEYPDAWVEVSRDTRRRLQSLVAVQGSSLLEPSVSSVYRSSLPVLREVLYASMSGRSAGGGGEACAVS